ncbi:uncharacterized protein LOC113509882 [Galleria mellonella]|uniref:Uncharacterized protein LOC113509882 n=1 Tax=Galleria mellonella TaxID=7137 RepID=A0A6J3C262_GALME|nr:uncharacterized protein LOC113509882 [Galleria mellonella]
MKKQNSKKQNKGASNPQFTSKPFCDCTKCKCNNCPDILEMLAITVTDKSCDFGSKVKGKKAQHDEPNVRNRPSLMNVIHGSECNCEVMAHAVRSHVHMNLGLPDMHTANTSEKQNSSNN